MWQNVEHAEEAGMATTDVQQMLYICATEPTTL